MTALDREYAIEDILDSYAGHDRIDTLRQLVALGVARGEAEGLLAEIESDLDGMSQNFLDMI